MPKTLNIYTDGACQGNPGLAGIGFIIQKEKEVIKEFSKAIGNATNNIAEYTAVIYALQEALILRADHIILQTDSELLYNQLIGNYKVKNQNIKPLFDQIRHLERGFKSIRVRQIPRDQNKLADNLAKKAIRGQTQMVAFPVPSGGEESPSSKG